MKHSSPSEGPGEHAAYCPRCSRAAQPSDHEASLRGRSLDLTPREFDFLAYLARNPGKVCTRRMILENVWGPGYARELHYLKVYVYRIRRKLGDESGELLQSDPAVGYRLAVPGD
jgi:two-component system, OmpR family, KDP operon response regulator KdpE